MSDTDVQVREAKALSTARRMVHVTQPGNPMNSLCNRMLLGDFRTADTPVDCIVCWHTALAAGLEPQEHPEAV